jgi:hypothetical protein
MLLKEKAITVFTVILNLKKLPLNYRVITVILPLYIVDNKSNYRVYRENFTYAGVRARARDTHTCLYTRAYMYIYYIL